MHHLELRKNSQFRKAVAACALVLVLAVAQSGAQTFPSTISIQRSGESEVLFNQGLIDLQDKKFKEARDEFTGVLQFKSDDYEARYYLALAQLSGGESEQAVESLTQLLDAQPDYQAARGLRASALIQLHRFPEAELDIAVLDQDASSRGTAAALRGRLNFEKKDYAKAAEEFEKARAAGMDIGSNQVLEGLSYLKMGNVQRSRDAFAQASTLQLDPALDTLSRQLQSAQGAANKPWKFTLVTGYEWDSNVVLFDEGVVKPSDISRQDDGRIIVAPSASYSFISTKDFEAGIDTNDYFSFQSTLSDFDIASYQVGAYANWQILKNIVVGMRYDFNDVELGHEPYLKRNVVTGQLTLFEEKLGYSTLYTQFDRRQYEEISGTGALDRDGPVYGIGLVQSINLPEFFAGAGSAELQLAGRFLRQTTSGPDFDARLYDAAATLIVPLPWKFTADFGTHFDWEDYDNPNSLDVGGDKRRDFEYNLTAGLSRRINEWVVIRGEYAYTNHDSNVQTAPDPFGGAPEGVNPYEFTRHVVGLKVIVSF